MRIFIVKDSAVGRELQSKLIQKAKFCARSPDPECIETGSPQRCGRTDPLAGKSGSSHGISGLFFLLPEFEITLLNYDSFFIREVETMLSNDFTRSKAATMDDYIRRPFLFKLAVRFARLLAPIL